jgi:hypothetical protein
MQELSPKDVQDLLSEGYSMKEIGEAVTEIKTEEATGMSMDSPQMQQQQMQMQQPQGRDPRSFAQNSAFAPQFQDNLIKWQLELDNILERAEHILRGDKLIFEYGSLVWKANTDPKDNILNEYGVQEIMRIMSMYLNRNTILSDYEDEEINYKVLDFGRELNDLFFSKSESMGLITTFEEMYQKMFNIQNKVKLMRDGTWAVIYETEGKLNIMTISDDTYKYVEQERKKESLEKRKNYPMLHREILDCVHSCIKRAKHGGERRSLREARSITQTEQLQGGQGVTINTGGNNGGKTRGFLNPFRYLVGKTAT